MKNESSHRLFLGLHGNCVFKCAGYYISAASHNRLKGAGAALEIDDLDIKAFIFEITKLFGNGQRQVVVEAFSSNSNGDVSFFCCKSSTHTGCHHGKCSGGCGCNNRTSSELHNFSSIKKVRFHGLFLLPLFISISN